jgi:hypothetical protein
MTLGAVRGMAGIAADEVAGNTRANIEAAPFVLTDVLVALGRGRHQILHRVRRRALQLSVV